MPNIPEQLLNSLSQLPHFDREAFVEAHREENRITSVRLNPFKSAAFGFETSGPVPWNEQGFYLKQRPYFTHDPLFHAGCYYVQEAGSMFLGYAMQQTLDLRQPLTILDACASPGGKSTLVNALMKPSDLLVSNEIIRSRAGVLAGNLGRWGTRNTIVTNNETARFTSMGPVFDALVVDAPCSGSGLFRKQPEAVDEWSQEAVTACSLRQRNILSDLVPCLKEGGHLYYSTCSYSVEENEAVVEWLVAEQGLSLVNLQVDPAWGIVSGAGHRFYPQLTGSEGFFLAVLRKITDSDTASYRRPGRPEAPGAAESLLAAEFADLEGAELFKKNGQLHMICPPGAAFLAAYESQFYFRKAGTVIGEVKGQDLVPNQELAWSIHLRENVPAIELSPEEALLYLKKENLRLPASGKGFTLMQYRKNGIGWAKILPNRTNNYLPPELRILK